MKPADDCAAKFINALIKSVQTLCHGYLDFNDGIKIIGHLNLCVDDGTSLDYILKEKVCKNAENSTLFISNSFHAEPKPEQEVPGKDSRNQRTTEDSEESGRLGSAISSISSALSSSHDRQRRSGTKDSNHTHSNQNLGKRKASDDGDIRPSKVSSHHESSSASQSPYHSQSSPVDSKEALRSRLRPSTDHDMGESETMLPQTAGVSSDSTVDIGVNLAGSVLEPVDQGSGDRDDDSDNDLEVTFIKEEFVEGERSACEYENSSQQYGGLHSRASEGMVDPSMYPGAHHSSSASATYVPGALDFPSTSQSQPGSSGMRGVPLSGLEIFVDSLTSRARDARFSQLHFQLPSGERSSVSSSKTSHGSRKEHRSRKEHNSRQSRQHNPMIAYSQSHASLRTSFDSYRDNRRKKKLEKRHMENKTKENLQLMNEGYRHLLEQKSAGSAERYNRAMEKEKQRLAKQQYRAMLSEKKKEEIKMKDKERKRQKRAMITALTADSMSSIIEKFSLSECVPQSNNDLTRTWPPVTVGSPTVSGTGNSNAGNWVTDQSLSQHSHSSTLNLPVTFSRSQPDSGDGAQGYVRTASELASSSASTLDLPDPAYGLLETAGSGSDFCAVVPLCNASNSQTVPLVDSANRAVDHPSLNLYMDSKTSSGDTMKFEPLI